MKEKDIKRIIRKQLKSEHPNWKRIHRKRKKEIIKEITDAVAADYQVFDEELGIPIEELIGIEQQQPDSRIIPLQDMANFVDNFYEKAGLLKFFHKNYLQKKPNTPHLPEKLQLPLSLNP
ncbi:MAG: hypothetical protein D3903_19850, partial [Candidatus Electrothrix sp. GM3_4]|nr:hypothetical protein [Candidatus Electrothrix sp. GM3_4]